MAHETKAHSSAFFPAAIQAIASYELLLPCILCLVAGTVLDVTCSIMGGPIHLLGTVIGVSVMCPSLSSLYSGGAKSGLSLSLSVALYASFVAGFRVATLSATQWLLCICVYSSVERGSCACGVMAACTCFLWRYA